MKRSSRRRRYRHTYRKNDMKAKAVFAVLAICFSVGAGYMTANYIIGPALGLKAQPISVDFFNEEKETENKEDSNKPDDIDVVQDELSVDSNSGFALQYGSFSSKAGAQQCVKDLENRGIEAGIIEKDGSFKVIGKVFETEEEARSHKDTFAAGEDIFITEIP